MSDIKPEVPRALSFQILEQQFSGDVYDVKSIEGGSIAQAFTFSAGGQECIIRFDINKMDANYEKEGLIAKEVGSALVPIPVVTQVSQIEEAIISGTIDDSNVISALYLARLFLDRELAPE